MYQRSSCLFLSPPLFHVCLFVFNPQRNLDEHTQNKHGGTGAGSARSRPLDPYRMQNARLCTRPFPCGGVLLSIILQ
ncbi:hypothetical protein LX32DRAFT_641011 [Colletotrichum zoysiae]|uniref:Uncharacterized protein n=1 Tax=Colletotrichum zoysiae TaxID=1216348 RepID=A0AAD9HEC9_9PEZI|nr:hypothetical protein LX32DRAFT_641011 [Colletotrichum zoysiae]